MLTRFVNSRHFSMGYERGEIVAPTVHRSTEEGPFLPDNERAQNCRPIRMEPALPQPELANFEQQLADGQRL